MDATEIEQRFRDALRQAELLKEGAQAVSAADAPTLIEETTKGFDQKQLSDRKPPSALTLINLFQHPAAHPYVLDLALLREYGPEWMEWERETLEYQIPRNFRTTGISDLNMSKLQAIKTLHLVDSFWQDWEVFIAVAMPLNGLFPDFDILQAPTVAQCAVAIDIANRVRPVLKWSDEMLAYLATVHQHDGVACAVENLSFVELDNEDYPVDCAAVQELWPAVRRSGKAPTDDSSTSEQLRRLLAVHETVRESQNQLAAQLPLLLHG
mgnify:CR=1 FL=1